MVQWLALSLQFIEGTNIKLNLQSISLRQQIIKDPKMSVATFKALGIPYTVQYKQHMKFNNEPPQ